MLSSTLATGVREPLISITSISALDVTRLIRAHTGVVRLCLFPDRDPKSMEEGMERRALSGG